MVETLHPDVFTQEVDGTPSIVGVSTSTVGFVGTARMGAVDELTLVTGFTEFVNKFGQGLQDSFLEDAVFNFFQNGGARCLISRVVGAGALAATDNAPALAGAAAAAQIDGANAEPFDLEPADTISVSVDGAPAQVFTFLATRATYVAGGAASPPAAGGEALVLSFDGGSLQTVTFTAAATSADLIAGEINSQVTGGRCVNVAGTLQLESDTRGLGSSAVVDVTSDAPSLALTGFTVGSAAGTGNVQNIDAVTTAESLALVAGLAGAVATDNAGAIRITHGTPGVGNTVEVTAAAAAFGFPAGSVDGVNSAPIDLFSVTAQNPGAWGNAVSYTTERWRALTTEILSNGGTEVAIDNLTLAEIGDIVLIDDGTTSVIVHVRSVDLVNSRIQFNAVVLGAPIAVGAVANTASSHRSRTTFAADAAAVDTLITVVNPSQMRVGTELSLDNGTAVIFRKVAVVNGSEITLDAALGIAFLADDPVALQHFNLTVLKDNVVDRTHTFLSLQEDDQQDFVEFRLSGTSNQSNLIEVLDLTPVIAVDLEDRPGAVSQRLLSGGAEGVTPIDNDYLGAVAPPTGLQLFENQLPGVINIITIPGISSLAVQQGLSDFADRKANMVGIIDPPLSQDEPLEIRDWRLNQFNRDTSYSALYYPWLTISDRNSAVSGALKDVPPSGHVTGLYARVDAEVGVWEAPGNRPLRNVFDVVTAISNGQHDLLNPVGINVIRSYPGQGIRVMGVRTLSNLTDGRQYVNVRRLLNFVKISVSEGLRQFIFRGIQPSLFSEMEAVVRAFLRSIWLQGGLFPNNDFSQAHFVKVDLENNPVETRKLGQLFVDAGINPPIPAEFIIFKIGLFDGETSVAESAT